MAANGKRAFEVISGPLETLLAALPFSINFLSVPKVCFLSFPCALPVARAADLDSSTDCRLTLGENRWVGSPTWSRSTFQAEILSCTKELCPKTNLSSSFFKEKKRSNHPAAIPDSFPYAILTFQDEFLLCMHISSSPLPPPPNSTIAHYCLKAVSTCPGSD